MDELNIFSEFIEESKKLGQTMPKRKGGRYTKQEKGIHSYDSFFKILFSELINNKINSSSKGLQI